MRPTESFLVLASEIGVIVFRQRTIPWKSKYEPPAGNSAEPSADCISAAPGTTDYWTGSPLDAKRERPVCVVPAGDSLGAPEFARFEELPAAGPIIESVTRSNPKLQCLRSRVAGWLG
jgi:hypothetical protein